MLIHDTLAGVLKEGANACMSLSVSHCVIHRNACCNDTVVSGRLNCRGRGMVLPSGRRYRTAKLDPDDILHIAFFSHSVLLEIHAPE